MNEEGKILRKHIYDCCNKQLDVDGISYCKGCPYDFNIENNALCYLILMGIGDENVK